MTGTIVNCIAVAVGGSIGCLFKKAIKESYMESINKSLGLAVLVIGFNGIVAHMVKIKEVSLESSGELMLVIFLVIGTFIGELLKLEERFEKFCRGIENKFSKGGFAPGFINGTVLFTVGALTIMGSLNDGINNDPSLLFIKSALDFVSSIVFGATLGYGVIFTFIPLLIYQGGITLAAGALSGFLQGELLTQICFVGYTIIIAIGLNFLITKKIKILNTLPSLFLPIIYQLILKLIEAIK
jgi:uncharacterized membrane protein YqgA involved in biofilm formation